MELKPLGTIYTPFEQKLGIPRQPGLAPSALGHIVFDKEFAREECLRRLEGFSHLWLLYWCHQSESWRETIRPPRLGGKEKVGFMATRSPHRPNPLGLSVVKLEEIKSDFSLIVSGVDILNESPLIDLKPYLPLWDSHPEASMGWVEETPELSPLPVQFRQKENIPEDVKTLIEETLRWDPRPAYTKDEERSFIHQIGGVEVTWKKEKDSIIVSQIKVI